MTNPKSNSQPAFHLILPSLPGYGFSSQSTEEGMDIQKIAKMMVQLMSGLEYRRYGAAGGDWGGLCASYMAILDPSHCRGLHLNMPLTDFEPQNLITQLFMTFDYALRGFLFTSNEVEAIEKLDEFEKEESGYSALQCTRPQTLSYALSDSPVGLAAWMVEKFRSWSDCSETNFESVWPMDELLTHIMIYWVTNTAASSSRLYYESKKRLIFFFFKFFFFSKFFF